MATRITLTLTMHEFLTSSHIKAKNDNMHGEKEYKKDGKSEREP